MTIDQDRPQPEAPPALPETPGEPGLMAKPPDDWKDEVINHCGLLESLLGPLFHTDGPVSLPMCDRRTAERLLRGIRQIVHMVRNDPTS